MCAHTAIRSTREHGMKARDTPRFMTQRIGILGGTFDPVHNGHLAIARAALDQGNLDRILFVVAARPPHKKDNDMAAAEDRYRMVELAVADEPAMEPSRIEMARDGLSYTSETLETLHAEMPGASLFLVFGLDTLMDVPTWHRAEFVLANAHILTIPRPGDFKPDPILDGSYTMLEFEPMGVSSTRVREAVRRGEPLDGMVPGPVARYIQERGIYRDP